MKQKKVKYHLNRIVLFTILFISPFSSNRIVAQVTSYSNEFMNIGIDASSMAQGNAVIAEINGVCAGYWNPGAIVNMEKKMEASLMHANYFSGMAQYDYLGAAYKPEDSLALGFSLIRFGVDDIPNTLNLVDENGNVNYDRITYFSVADYALFFSASRKSKIEGLTWGASLKLIYRKQGEFASAYGFGFDVGAQYSLKKWKFGAVLRDATSTFNVWIFNTNRFEEIYRLTGNEMPKNNLELTIPKLLLGGAYQFKINDKISAITELDLDCYFDGENHSFISGKTISISPHWGFQISYLKNIHLRGGIDKLQWVGDYDNNKKMMLQASIGVGICLYNISFDYALTDVGDMTVAPISHLFSLKYAFNKLKN